MAEASVAASPAALNTASAATALLVNVFAEDKVLRNKIKDICKKHMQVDEAMDQEVRDRIKNLEEGTSAWDVEYAKVLDQIKSKHGVKE